MDWVTAIVIPIFGTIAGLAGYALRGIIDRRNAPRIEADKKILSERLVRKVELLDNLSSLFFDLDHWLRRRIPNARNAVERERFILLSETTAMQARSDARHATGITPSEKEQIVQVVHAETDAILECLSEYTSGRQPSFDRLDQASAERRLLVERLSRRIPS